MTIRFALARKPAATGRQRPATVRARHAAAFVSVVLAAVAGCGTGPARLVQHFAGPNGLIAAEHHPGDDGFGWVMTSGSLYRVDGQGWSGKPDAGDFAGATGSAVFRMVSIERSFGDVDVRIRLRVDELTQTRRTPARDYDGVHVWVRYRSDKQLYAVSVDRRDATMIIKKKCPGGDANGGTYYDLTPSIRDAAIPSGRWQDVAVSVRDRSDGSVAIDASRDGVRLHAVDTGVGCPPLTGTGAVGIRGDNAEFRIGEIVVEPNRGAVPTPPG